MLTKPFFPQGGSAFAARFDALTIAFGPVVFQCVRYAWKRGMLQAIPDTGDDGVTVEQRAATGRWSACALKVVLETCGWAGVAHPCDVTPFGENKTSQKATAVGKSDDVACNWVFLSAMIRLQKHAQSIGANAVTNIRSNYNNVEKSSTTDVECHAGALMAGVALKADFVKVAQ